MASFEDFGTERSSSEISPSSQTTTTMIESRSRAHTETKSSQHSPHDKESTSVVITVHPPELREGKFGVGSYHIYKVTMVPNDVEHVFRRYKDFEILRSSLTAWFPGCFVPPLPPKKILASLDEKFIADRRADLQRFLIRVAELPFLFTSPPFKLFISRATTYDDGLRELMQKQQERNVSVVLKEYRNLFPDLAGSKSSEDNEKSLLALKEFLDNSEKRVRTLEEDATHLAAIMNAFQSQLSKLTISLDQLYTEEKGFPSRPDPPRLDVLETVNAWHVGIKQLTPFYHTHFAKNFTNELQDIFAFQELFVQRNAIVAEYKRTAKRAEKWSTMTGTLTQQQETQKAEDLEKEKEYVEFVGIITQLMLTRELNRFWKERQAGWKGNFSTFASEQHNTSKLASSLWNHFSTSL